VAAVSVGKAMTLETGKDLQRLLDQEPFVRSLAQALLHEEADDVVQQTWLLALRRRGAAVREPRHWLARIVRNVVANLRRGRERRDARERAAAVHELVPSSADLMEREERRRALVCAVDRLPPSLRTVVLLRWFENLAPRAIARDLGLPVATVWNQLRQSLQLLRERLDAEHGSDRRAWLLPLVPFALGPRGLSWQMPARTSLPGASLLLPGLIAMTTKTKLAVAAGAVLLAAGAFLLWPGFAAPGSWPGTSGDAAPKPMVAAIDKPDAAAARPGAIQREVIAEPAAGVATTGTLVVHVRYGDDHAPATDLTVITARPGGDFRIGLCRAHADKSGTAKFEALRTGKVRVRTDRLDSSTVAEIRGGETTEIDLDLKVALLVSGIVVDHAGAPIGGALIDLGTAAMGECDAETVTSTAADGTFAVRTCFNSFVLVGARAGGYAASPLQSVSGTDGDAVKVSIELSSPGGMVDGVVLAPDGAPVPDALVRIGNGRMDVIEASYQGGAPLPVQVRTDAEGRFHAVGIAPGPQPVMVRAIGFAPWAGTCEVAANQTVQIPIRMSAGVTCVGIVRGSDGAPASKVDVRVGEQGEFLQLRARTAEDGTFTLADLPVGETDLTVRTRDLGKGAARVHGDAGATVHCELQLSTGLSLRGRVLDESGAPVAGAWLDFVSEVAAERWIGSSYTDAEGRFTVVNCPEGLLMLVDARATGIVPMERRGIDPRAGDLLLEVKRETAPHAHIVGKVVGPDGEPCAGNVVDAWRQKPRGSAMHVIGADGRFDLEVTAGTWQLQVESKEHALFIPDAHELAAGAIWDLGTIRLTHGGRLRVGLGAAEPAAFHLLIYDDRERFLTGVGMQVQPLQSELLAAGSYRLLVRGSGVAAQALPFAIRDGEVTQLDVRTTPGVRQRVEYEAAAGVQLPRWVGLEVRHAGTLVLTGTASAAAGRSFTAELWLAPGSYTLRASADQLTAIATFTLGEREGDPIRVELR